MDLRAYLDILRRRGWIILVVAVIGAVAALGLSLVQTKTYRATARIGAVPAGPTGAWATAPKTCCATSSTTSAPMTWRIGSLPRRSST